MSDTSEPKEPGRYDLFLLTQAYNRGEINLEEWMQRTRAWAEAVKARALRSEGPAKRVKPD